MRSASAIVRIGCLVVFLVLAQAAVAGAPATHLFTRAPSGGVSQAPVPSGPSLQITGLESCGCGIDGIVIDYSWCGIPVGSVGRILVVVDGVVYEDTVNPSITNTCDNTSFALFNDNSGGTATGTWPLPSGKPVEITATVTTPNGNFIVGWKAVLDSCSGTCAFSSSAAYTVSDPVPATTRIGLAALAALLAIAGVAVLLRSRAS